VTGTGAAPPLLDEEILTRLHDDFASTDDLAELAALIRNFVRRAEEQVTEIVTALERGDVAQVRMAGHKLKGSSNTLGAVRLGAVAGDVEAAGAGAEQAAVIQAVRELELAFRHTRAALEERADAIAHGT